MKVIILCAGRGRRFKLKKPKCLLTLGKKTLLEICLNNLKSNNIKPRDIIFATGFKEDLIRKKIGNKFTFIKNKSYLTTNMVYTFFNTIKNVSGHDIVITYSDIVFNAKDIKNLIKSKNKFTTLVDVNWEKIWAKKGKLLEDSETLKIKNNQIISLGKKTKNIKNIDGRFVGITKISSELIENLKLIYKKNLKNNPKKFKKIDMTNFFNYLIQKKYKLFFTKTHRSWYEFDDKKDLNSYIAQKLKT